MSGFIKAIIAPIFLVILFIAVALSVRSINNWAQGHRNYEHAYESDEPPYVNHNDGKKNNEVYPGQLFFVRHKFSKTSECSIISSKYLKDVYSPLFYSLGSTTTSWMEIGTYDLNEAYTMPTNVPYGTYRFIFKNVAHCGNEDYYTIGFDVLLIVSPRPIQ